MARRKQSASPEDPARPRPPESLLQPDGPVFLPAPEVEAWIRGAFLARAGSLFNEEHSHLDSAKLGVLWTGTEHQRQMRMVIGQAEKPRFQGNPWTKARQEQQMLDWFGQVPDFVLTFDARFASNCSDLQWCAVVEHELLHCAQALDDLGAPKFSRAGLPVFTLRGHDVEEFVTVVRRYGAAAAGPGVVAMVEAAGRMPEIGAVSIDAACGTCRAIL